MRKNEKTYSLTLDEMEWASLVKVVSQYAGGAYKPLAQQIQTQVVSQSLKNFSDRWAGL
jgi:hypothetical protein